MTNTEELRKKFDEKMRIYNEDMWHVVFTNRNGDKLIVEDLFTFTQSEIEAAEEAKVEEVIGILKRIACFEIPVTNERDEGFVDALDSAISQIENKFLNTPE